MNWRITVIFLFISLATNVHSGDLIDNAVIEEIASSNDGYSDNFYLRFSSGNGLCQSGGAVVFPISLAPSESAYNRMYSTAMMAFALGKKVRVFSHGSNDCLKASFIQVYK